MNSSTGERSIGDVKIGIGYQEMGIIAIIEKSKFTFSAFSKTLYEAKLVIADRAEN